MSRALTAADQEESESSLLSSRRDSDCDSLYHPHNNLVRDSRMPTTKGQIRAYWLGALLNFAGFQFGVSPVSFAIKRAHLMLYNSTTPESSAES